jgi:hypothetical protein
MNVRTRVSALVLACASPLFVAQAVAAGGADAPQGQPPAPAQTAQPDEQAASPGMSSGENEEGMNHDMPDMSSDDMSGMGGMSMPAPASQGAMSMTGGSSGGGSMGGKGMGMGGGCKHRGMGGKGGGMGGKGGGMMGGMGHMGGMAGGGSAAAVDERLTLMRMVIDQMDKRLQETEKRLDLLQQQLGNR